MLVWQSRTSGRIEEICPSLKLIMTESTNGIQCTDTNDQNGTDLLAPIADLLGHKLNPEEVQYLYNDATELAQKHKASIQYIEELQRKIRQLEQRVEDGKRELSTMRRQLASHNHEDRPEARDESRMVSGTDEDCGWMGSSSEDRTNRDLIQRLLLKISNLENENKELRQMYGNLLREKDTTQERLVRQCLQQEEQIQQLQNIQQLFVKKEEECRIAQKEVKELQIQIQEMKDNVESFQHSSAGFPDAPLAVVVQDECTRSQDDSSIHLKEPTSPSMKRGRFIMERRYPFECSNCSAFFLSKEEAAKTDCCYHPLLPVPAILRHGSANVDPVSRPEIFWPCCRQIGKQAVKCARGGPHRFKSCDDKNPER